MQGEEGMGKCSRCGTESDTRFCPNCGMSMEQDTSISGLVEQGDYPNKESAINVKINMPKNSHINMYNLSC